MADSGNTAEPWNHNIQYFPFILGLVGEKPRSSALDVGSGDGMLAAKIADAVPSVVGLDSDEDQVQRARQRFAGIRGLFFERGDVLVDAVPGTPFDVVTCSATIHHLPLEPALERLRDLTAPGGTLVIVGLATEGSIGDWILSLASILPNRVLRRSRGWHVHGAPTADPHDTYSTIRTAGHRILPGSTFRRHLYWRYSLVWERPATS